MKPCSKNIHKTVTHDTESLHTRWEKHIHASSIVNSHAKQNRPLFNVYLTLRTNYLKTHVIVTEINTGEDWLLSLTIGSTGHISAMYEGLAYLTGCVRVWCRCTVAKHLNGWSWFLLCASPQQTATLLLHGVRILPHKGRPLHKGGGGHLSIITPWSATPISSKSHA